MPAVGPHGAAQPGPTEGTATEPFRGTGKAISSWAKVVAAPWGRWWSGQPGSSCCSTSAATVRPTLWFAAMRKAVATLPDELCQSITWDQGAEMANHVDFTIATDIPICPKESISRQSAPPSSTRSNEVSTEDRARPSAI